MVSHALHDLTPDYHYGSPYLLREAVTCVRHPMDQKNTWKAHGRRGRVRILSTETLHLPPSYKSIFWCLLAVGMTNESACPQKTSFLGENFRRPISRDY
jgi:hypothetical protein